MGTAQNVVEIVCLIDYTDAPTIKNHLLCCLSGYVF